MTNEIKEILDRLDYNEWEVDLYKVPITWSELYDIRDYITNLQEENERLKNLYTNEKSHKIDCNYFRVLYSKADKNIIIDDLVYKCEQCRILYDSAEKKSIENYNLQQRIDKAIKYIKWNLDKNEELIEYFNYDGNFNELLDILRGDE